MARWRWLLAAALTASATSSVATVQALDEVENERTVSIDDIPAAARDAILNHVTDGTLMEVVEGTGQGGQPVYEGRINKGARRITIWVDAAGNVLWQRHVD
jgi:type IV secretory pathway VirJ component